ncbi:MAG: excinuclease ABC subunit UvrA, partial [Bryobacteraceae bacterium]
DTIYAEGQRRYVESLSAYARQFLERMEKPEVDEIVGLAPAIAIRQKNTTRNPRSTVATSTEIYDFLRLLFARAGRTHCPKCAVRVERDSVDQVAARLLALDDGARGYLLFPATRDRLPELRGKGFQRLLQHGRVFDFSTPESLLDIDFSQPLFAVADRIAIGEGIRGRLVDAVETCYKEAGEAVFEPADGGETLRFNEKFTCKRCGLAFAEPEPRLFSFNSPFGACPRCQGFGNTIDYDMDLVIPDPSRTLMGGAVKVWRKTEYRSWLTLLHQAAPGRVRMNVAYRDLTGEEKDFISHGDGKARGGFPGIRGFFDALEKKKYKLGVRIFLARYRGYTECPDCQGGRLRPEALYVRVADKNMREVTRMNIGESLEFFRALALGPEEAAIADKVLVEVRQRLTFLHDVGLDYLTLDRLSSTLSGGESQRIQLATCLGSRLVGACYVLDEPSIGLHSRDTGRLIRILHELRELGNTILVVEHDPEVMRAADHILDLGPGAGENGGRVVYQGSFTDLVSEPSIGSLTAQYLRGEQTRAVDRKRRPPV